MSVSPFDSALYRELFTTREMARLFSDSAEIRAMMLVEGSLAKVQGALGVIPAESAAFLHRAAMELQIDPEGLAAATGQNGVSVPGLVAAMRKALEAPEHAQYLHWGATSQDIIDTGLALRLRQAMALMDAGLGALLASLAKLAEAQAETPMAARTYGQSATPTSFGAVIAAWGAPLLTLRDDLAGLKPRIAAVSLSGAAGTGAALGPQAAETRAELAKALGLNDPGRSTHATRDHIAALAGWLTRATGALGKMGADLLIMAQSDLGEIRFEGAGASSTMPQKQNPVGASVLVALGAHVAALNTAMQGALVHRQERDGAAWFTEWLSLPPMVMGAGKAIALAGELAQKLAPQTARMAQNMDGPLGLIHAEALSFALAGELPRPEAQAAMKALCQEAQESGTALATLVARDYPTLRFEGAPDLGQAPAEARAFADAVAARGNHG